jgi:ribosomal protein S18 acetylase RimI-like enzyme
MNIEIISLFGEKELVHEVKKLNLGILPIQCPERCYKNAISNVNGFSFAACSMQEKEKRVIGGIIAEKEDVTLFIRTLAVDLHMRRNGIGRTLLNRLIETAKKSGNIHQICLQVHVNNVEAIIFYQVMGFRLLARIKNFYRHLDTPDCFEYGLNLNAK